MPRFAQLSACSVLALGIAAGPVAALTAQEVWDGFEETLTDFGYTVEATESSSGEGLNVSDLTLTFAVPEEDTTVVARVSQLDLVENSDGSVSLSLPDSIPISIDAVDEAGDDLDMVLDYSNSDLAITVSGTPGDMQYSYSAAQLAIKLVELMVDGTPVGRDEARFDIALDNVSGEASNVTDGATGITQTLTATDARYEAAFNDPESEATGLVSGRMESLSLASSTTLPQGFDPSTAAALSFPGFSASAEFDYENGAMSFAMTEESGTTTGETQTAAGRYAFAVENGAVTYDVSGTEQSLALAGPDMPVSISVSMAESRLAFTAPTAPSETPQDASMVLTLGGFTMSELLWNMVDPGAALPRDPATIMLDLSGKVTPKVNVFDPTRMAAQTGDDPVAELNALTLNDLTVEAAGAKFTGEGAFTFDNTDTQTFDGFPRPTGTVDFSLQGANTLIDKLIEMGALTTEDAMGARMMISMFAVPGEGEDTLNSSIEINDKGHVLANGMRIQ